MIAFESVSKSFWTGTRRKVILDQASFRIEPGRSLGILAPTARARPPLST
jgi:capsular polysaccharide transport system ATP-binding protein